ncbi:hypothetical protein LWI29_008766 [Acer saccharum]|uniref:Uncharacterized protein n=1 Tax=Acer saccharum TaxID=4024 RepID=A0AA39SYJ1_ACESA|nr:hypothetical protein LWI29_008766 [Acer saccharum]
MESTSRAADYSGDRRILEEAISKDRLKVSMLVREDLMWKQLGGLSRLRLKPTSKQPKVAEAVKIDKKRIASTMSNLEDSDSTDLGSSSDFGPGPNQMFLRGECSKRRSEERKSASGPGDGPHMLDNNKV